MREPGTLRYYGAMSIKLLRGLLATLLTPGFLGTLAAQAEPISVPRDQARWYITEGAGEIRPQEVFLWSAGVASTDFTGGGELTLWASADLCQGAPELTVTVDGKYAGVVEVNNEEGRKAYTLPGNHPYKNHRVSFGFLNDFKKSSCDRNVSLYAVSSYTDWGNPFAGAEPARSPGYLQEVKQAAQAPGVTLWDRLALARLGRNTNGVWLGQWTSPQRLKKTVNATLDAAEDAGTRPVFVLYAMGGCLGKSEKSLSPAAYSTFVKNFREAVGTRRASVILEPDALPFGATKRCAQNIPALREAVQTLAPVKNTLATYVDAGHSSWLPQDRAAVLLREVGISQVRGFSLNVANAQGVETLLLYGDRLAQTLSASYVVDTARSGGDAPQDTCNPTTVRPGQRSRAVLSSPTLDAYLWVKPPGESDGACKGAPQEGTFWRAYAQAFALRAAPLQVLLG